MSKFITVTNIDPADLISGGSSQIDGDLLHIDFAPSAYIDPSENILSAHLNEIDIAFTTIISNKTEIDAEAGDYVLVGDSDDGDTLKKVDIDAFINHGATATTIDAKVNEVGGISIGQVVYISGATGGFPQVSLAHNNDFSESDTIAVAGETKSDGQTINCVVIGELTGFDTSSFTEGDVLYLGASGSLTNVHPTGIDAVQRMGHAVKINVSTGSMLVEIQQLTIINDHDGIMRFQVVNQNAGASASTSVTLVNDEDQRCSLSMVGSNYTAVPGLSSSLVLYNEGYNKTVNAVDGNFGFEWWTDESDSHVLSATSKMDLTAAGDLTVVGTINGIKPQVAFTSLSGDTTLTSSHERYIKVDTSAGDVTLTLPLSIDGVHPYDVWKTTSDVNKVIIARAGSDTIIGETSFEWDSQYATYEFVPDLGTLWLVK